MISKEKLISSLNNSKFTEFEKLPESKYTQKTYTIINNCIEDKQYLLEQQKKLQTIVNNDLECNVVNPENIDNFDKLLKHNTVQTFKKNNINYNALLEYKENSIISLSEDIYGLFKSLEINVSSLKLIGFYNPNSFIKSVIVLNNPQYLLLNKFQMLSEINTYRSNLCYHYKQNKDSYTIYNDEEFNLIENNITNDNYHSFALSKIASDYLNMNILIIDNINKKYEYYISSLSNNNNNNIELSKINCYILIKYKECYLPIFNENGDKPYLFNLQQLLSILLSYEHINKIYSFNNNSQFNNNEDIIKEDSKLLLSDLININKYKKNELQNIAEAYDIPIIKKSPKGTYISKTKSDLFNDFSKVYYDENIMNKKEFL